MSTPGNIKKSISMADVVVGAVLIPGRKAPKLLTKEDLLLMKKGSVVVDVAVDQGGCFETTKATTHEEPTFMVNGVVHYCVANMPGAVARTSTMALTNTTLQPGLELAAKGVKSAVESNPHLKNGVNTYGGKCTNAAVADSLGISYSEFSEI
jgi:alanine dehydrogenase